MFGARGPSAGSGQTYNLTFDYRSTGGDFTTATRAEPGNIFFEWSRSVDDANQFVLVEAFQDDAGEAHVTSEHFKTAMGWMPDVVADTPDIISVQGVEGSGWGKMAEVTPR